MWGRVEGDIQNYYKWPVFHFWNNLFLLHEEQCIFNVWWPIYYVIYVFDLTNTERGNKIQKLTFSLWPNVRLVTCRWRIPPRLPGWRHTDRQPGLWWWTTAGLEPKLVIKCLFVLVCMICGSCTGGMCSFWCGMYALCCCKGLPILSYGYGDWFCLFGTRFVDERPLHVVFLCLNLISIWNLCIYTSWINW